MIFELLFTVFAVQQSVAGIILDKATNSALKTWSSYHGGNSDIQKALRAAFLHTVAAITLALEKKEKGFQSQLNKEFAEMVETEYLIPFCKTHRIKPENLQKIVKTQEKLLVNFFKDEQKFPFRRFSVEEVSSLLYNARFITEEKILRDQKKLAIESMKKNIKQNAKNIDINFLEFIFFAGKKGSCILYDGVLFFFEDEIKRKDEVAKKLAHFDRQQIQKEIRELSLKVENATMNRNWREVNELGPMLEKMELSQKMVWESAEQQLQIIHQKFNRLQKWLEDKISGLDDKLDKIITLLHGDSQLINNPRLRDDAVQSIQIRGSLIDLSYKKIRKLGRGGVGEVWEVEHLGLKERHALKILDPFCAKDPQQVARFLAEAQLARRLGGNANHIVEIYTTGGSVEQDEYFIDMQLINGKTLDCVIKEEGQLSEQKIIQILEQLCIALTAAHRLNIIHRDLKPQNIMIDDTDNVILMDFGIAKVLGEAGHTKTGERPGTPYYMAPEQWNSTIGGIGGWTDIYALGILTYEMATGRLPFRGTESQIMQSHLNENMPVVRQYNAQISERLGALIQKCTQKDPKKRYTSISELQKELKIIKIPPYFLNDNPAYNLKDLVRLCVKHWDIAVDDFYQKRFDQWAWFVEFRPELLQEAEDCRQECQNNRNQGLFDFLNVTGELRGKLRKQCKEAAEQKQIEDERKEAEEKVSTKLGLLLNKIPFLEFTDFEIKDFLWLPVVSFVCLLFVIGFFLFKPSKEPTISVQTSAKEPARGDTLIRHGIDLVYVPGGRFEMGDQWGDGDYDETLHTVELDGFYMGKYEVTVAQFKKFVDETGYKTTAEKEVIRFFGQEVNGRKKRMWIGGAM